MLNRIFLFVTILFPILVYGQNYTVETLTGEVYQPLTQGQLVTENWDENTTFFLDVAMSFDWYGKAFDFSKQDALLFYGLGLSELSEYQDSTSISALGFFAILQSRPEGSQLVFNIEGDEGDRIMKMEWVNAGFKNGDPDDFANFQVWFFESDARIEIHIGPNSVAGPNAFIAGAPGPKIGLYRKYVKKHDNKVFKSWILTGDPANPGVNTSSLQLSLDAVPDDGTVYIFTDAGATALPRLKDQNEIKVYPNPTQSLVHINLPESMDSKGQLRILDMRGRIVSQYDIQNPQTLTLDISSWKTGVYSLHFKDMSGSIFTQRIVKID